MSTIANDDRRIRQLIEAATQAFATGQAQQGERLVRMAEAQAPRHPLVLNEQARRKLLEGNPAAAHEILEQAVELDSSVPSLWLNLAAARRGLNRPEDEMAALEHVLSMQPNNARALLQKASLEEIRGKPRDAAMTYHAALRTIPPGIEPPAGMQPIVAHARQVVDSNNRALEGFLEQRLKELRNRHSDAPLGRFDRCLATLLQKRPIYRPKPSFMYFPHLPEIEFYDRADFPWLDSIEAATDDIRAELVNVLAEGPEVLTPYVTHAGGVGYERAWREINRSRRWGVYYLWREGSAVQDHIERCPRTVAALEAWPRCEVPGCGPTAVFSILDARTRIPPHSGVNNTRLIVHVPLIVPPGCGFRVGAEQREWNTGEAFVFDDTFEHEAWNDSDVPRAVLILDIWSPLVTEPEREMVREAIAGVNEYYGHTLSHMA